MLTALRRPGPHFTSAPSSGASRLCAHHAWFGYCTSGGPCHSGRVEVTATDVARVPAGNLRVPRDEFAAVWSAAEAHQEEQARRQVADWYGAGVVMTCRWVAGAMVRPARGPWGPAAAPVTERLNQAYEELIEAEYL